MDFNQNQLVQFLSSNGQIMTTTLANLQSMGLTAQTQISATTPQQYSSQIQTNGNIIVGNGQTGGLPIQTQVVTNTAGQVFAITSQIPNQTIQTNPMVSQTPTNATQDIQIGEQPNLQQNSPNVSNTQTVDSPNTKLGKGIPLQKQSQQVIRNVFNYLRTKSKSKNHCYEETSVATKVSLNSMIKLLFK